MDDAARGCEGVPVVAVFRRADHRQSEHLDLAVAGARHPRGVVCLVSALAWHDLTDQIPHEVHLALPPGAWTPRGTYAPLRTYRFSVPSLTAGVERHEVLGVGVKVFSAAKSVAGAEHSWNATMSGRRLSSRAARARNSP